MYSEEKEISISTLIIGMIRGTKKVILCAILFGCIFAAYKYVKTDSLDNLSGEKVSYKDIKPEEKLAVEQAVNLHRDIGWLEEYSESAPFADIDYMDVEYQKTVYKIELDDAQDMSVEEYQKNMKSCISVYYYYINQGFLANDLCDLGCDIEEKYVRDMISCWYDSSNLDNSSSFVVTIYMIGNMNQYVGRIDELLQGYYESNLSESIPAHTIVKLDTMQTTGQYNYIRDMRDEVNNRLTDLLNNLESTTDSFSDEQKAYYHALLEKEDYVIENYATISVNRVKTVVKFAIIGIVLGGIVACGYIVVKILMSNRIYAQEDYEFLQLKYFGAIVGDEAKTDKVNKHKNAWNRFQYGDVIDKTYDENLAYIALKLKLAAGDVRKIVLTSSCLNAISDSVLEDLVEKLKKEGIEAEVLDNVLTDADRLKTLIETAACVFIEKSSVSRIKDVQEISALCTENDVKILGAINVM